MVCEHKKIKSRCIECEGGSICEHKKVRSRCIECQTVEEILSKNIICHGCCSTFLSKQRKNILVCAECDPRVPQRTEKIIVPLLLDIIDFPPSSKDDTVFGGNTCNASKRRPDLLWLWFDRVVSLELDEHSHRDRSTLCELGKMHDQFVSWQTLIGPVPVFYIRFNPDEFDGERTTVEHRISTVAQRVNELLTMDVEMYSPLVPHVEFFYYHSCSQHHIDAIKNAPNSFNFYKFKKIKKFIFSKVCNVMEEENLTYYAKEVFSVDCQCDLFQVSEVVKMDQLYLLPKILPTL